MPPLLQLFVFDINGRNVASTAAGAVATLSSTYGTNYASFGGDLYCDAWGASSSQSFVNAGCTAQSDYYQVIFP